MYQYIKDEATGKFRLAVWNDRLNRFFWAD